MKPDPSSPEQLVPQTLKIPSPSKIFFFLGRVRGNFFQRCKAARWMGETPLPVTFTVSVLWVPWRQHPKPLHLQCYFFYFF